MKAAFTTIFRTTGTVNKALRDTALAADLARAKHLGLSQAALIVAKTEAGNTTLLRRQGFQITKNATAEEALAKLRQVVAGQARAGTTAQERFGAVLHNTEEIIGTALLPTLNRYLSSAAKWLTNMNESGRLQKDVESATRTLSEAIGALKTVLSPLVQGFKLLAAAAGGTKNALVLLGSAFVVLKARAALVGWGLLAGEISGVGGAAAGARGKVLGLGGALRSLPSMIAVTLLVDELITQRQADKSVGDFMNRTGAVHFLGRGKAGDRVKGPGGSPAVLREINGQLFSVPVAQKNPLAKKGFGSNIFGGGRAAIPQSVSGTGSSPFSLTPAQRRAIDLAGEPTLAALRAQRDFDKSQIAALQKRFQAGKVGAKSYTAALVRLKEDLAQQESAIASIVDEQARLAKDQAKAAATRARKALEAAAENVRIFLEGISRGVKLGVDVKKAAKDAADAGAFKVPQALQIAAARTQALGLDDQAKRIAIRIRTAAFKAIRSGRLGFQGYLDAWTTIGQINDQLKNQSGAVKGKFKHIDPNKLLAGFGLSADQRRALASAIAQIGLAGRVPAIRSRPFGQPEMVVHTHVHLDGREVESSVTKHQRKDSQRRSTSRRGPYAGRH